MKFSEAWLREWVNPPLSTAEWVQQLTMAGFEVEAVEGVAPPFRGVVVAEVLDVAPHPQADRLRVCRVAMGAAEESLQVVCGAANVAAGLRVPLAQVGAQLPGGIVIQDSLLRGVRSQGMLCSAKELGLADHAEGLLVLPADARVGEDLRACLALDDVSLTLNVTPNRGDCLSVAGVAREAAALNRLAVQAPALFPVTVTVPDVFPVKVEDPAACPLYVGRVIRGIHPAAVTPIWMRERLRRSGVRSLHPVVDVTNYVLLELGQPLHAFDLAKLQGGVVVRQARLGETFPLLDGEIRSTDESTLVIADDRGPVALAGIMGGLSSAVVEDTRDLFLESAFFLPAALAGRARRYGLHTESSYRFERGVDPELAHRAMERTTGLLLGIVGGQAGPLIERRDEGRLPDRLHIGLRKSQILRLLGVPLPDEEVEGILTRLGMQVIRQGQDWSVSPPRFRFDLRIETDLIEELARLYGYGALPRHHPAVPLRMAELREEDVPVSRLRQTLIDRGYQEVITYSFVDPALQAALEPEQDALVLANPLSPELAVMRTSLWPGLLQTLVYNHHRQQTRVRLFEVGTRFRREEETVIAGVAWGPAYPPQWGMALRDVDFFDVKADVEALFGLGGEANRCRLDVDPHPALHPGQAAAIYTENGVSVGHLGELHPAWVQRLGLTRAPVLFELRLVGLRPGRLPRSHELSRFPAIRRDLAVVVAEHVPSAALCAEVVRVAGELLQELRLFDVYRGKGIDSGKKSLALGLTLQDTSRTLTDDDVEGVIVKVLARLREQFDATLRE